MIREIVTIDESKCDGCGLCIPSCHEGALRLVDGKARLVADRMCDGLGACLGHCPRGAIQIERRDAAAFDETLLSPRAAAGNGPMHHPAPTAVPAAAHCPAPPVPHDGGGHGGGCPGSRFAQFARRSDAGCGCDGGAAEATPASELTHWPVQLRLLSPQAPALRGARLLVAADCVPVAYPAFQQSLLRGRVVVIGCPKFDDVADYVERLAEMIRRNELREIVVARMEVPCCMGITAAVVAARRLAGVDVPVTEVVISAQGDVRARRAVAATTAAPY
jgi:NAD-dependent dihydropyrimidine dehydrogenase PreA subunit